MPYVRKEPRVICDPHIDEIVYRVRSTYPIDLMGSPLRFVCAALVVTCKRGWVASHNDEAITRLLAQLVQNFAGVIRREFVAEQAEGVLNYAISRIVVGSFIPTVPCEPALWPYSRIAAVLDTMEGAKLVAATIAGSSSIEGLCGPFEGAKLEFYRRVAGPKEDIAIRENGDIPEYAESPIVDDYVGLPSQANRCPIIADML